MTTLESGRVRLNDVITIKRVLTLTHLVNDQYSIIVNKLRTAEEDALRNSRNKEVLIDRLVPTEHYTRSIYYASDYANPNANNLSAALQSFVAEAPEIIIPADQARALQEKDLARTAEQLVLEVQQLREENLFLKQASGKLKKRI